MLCEGANVNNKGLSLEPCGTFPRPGAGTGQAGEEGWRCARQPRWQPRPLLTRPELGMWVGGGAGHPNQTHPGHPHTNRPSIRPKTPNHPLSSYSSLPLGYIESNSSSCGISPLASLWKGEIANYWRNWLSFFTYWKHFNTLLDHILSWLIKRKCT